MWPFRKKVKPQKFDRAAHLQGCIEKLKAFRQVGEKFNYLGVEMITTGHSRLECYGITLDIIPVLKADYVDATGNVQNAEWLMRELPCLLAENDLTEH